jgi:hypothetical protein
MRARCEDIVSPAALLFNRFVNARQVITETSALGEERARWLHELSIMAEELLDEGVELEGICLYPILGMPEWHDRNQWARMGLWDLEREQNVLQRKTCAPMLAALRSAQRRQSRQVADVEQVFTLPRTGNVPLVIYGRQAWHNGDADAPYSLRLIRSDQPYRLWIAAVEVSCGETTVQHVCTAAELSLLVQQLRWFNPTRIAAEHGCNAIRFDEKTHAQWQQDVDAIADGAPAFEAITIERRTRLPKTPVAGGGRASYVHPRIRCTYHGSGGDC